MTLTHGSLFSGVGGMDIGFDAAGIETLWRPDDHTRYDDKGNELTDSARYKMCGNGIASPVAQWIGENIVEAYGA